MQVLNPGRISTSLFSLYSSIISAMEKYGENVADYPVFISYTGTDTDAKELQAELERYLGENVKILINAMNPYNEYYVGNKALAISFHNKID